MTDIGRFHWKLSNSTSTGAFLMVPSLVSSTLLAPAPSSGFLAMTNMKDSRHLTETTSVSKSGVATSGIGTMTVQSDKSRQNTERSAWTSYDAGVVPSGAFGSFHEAPSICSRSSSV